MWGFQQDTSQRGVFRDNDALNLIVAEKILPARLDVDGSQIGLEELVAVEIVAVVERNFSLRIEPVNQISSPRIGGEDRGRRIMLLQIIDGSDGKTLGVEVCVHPLNISESAAVEGNPPEQKCYNGWPEVTVEAGIDQLHSSKK